MRRMRRKWSPTIAYQSRSPKLTQVEACLAQRLVTKCWLTWWVPQNNKVVGARSCTHFSLSFCAPTMLCCSAPVLLREVLYAWSYTRKSDRVNSSMPCVISLKLRSADEYVFSSGQQAVTDNVKAELDKFPAEVRDEVVILFSAHSLPMKVKSGVALTHISAHIA